MIQQQSFQKNQKGLLYLVPTPIGNLEDMTFRAIKVLKEVDLILAEDTRHSIKLLNYFEIETEMTSFHEHSSQNQVQSLLRQVIDGKTMALISDAGMPLINDPGHPLVEAFLKEQISVIALPGANAALTALIASGLNTQRFTYYGFFPRETKEQKALITLFGDRDETAIFYESPFRIKKTIQILTKLLEADTRVVLARELTKQYEEYVRGTLEEVNQTMNELTLKGEYVLLVEGNGIRERNNETLVDSSLTLKQQVDAYMQTEQVTSKEAIKMIAKLNRLKKQVVYQAYHEIEQ